VLQGWHVAAECATAATSAANSATAIGPATHSLAATSLATRSLAANCCRAFEVFAVGCSWCQRIRCRNFCAAACDA
jgi:hypothetical protein